MNINARISPPVTAHSNFPVRMECGDDCPCKRGLPVHPPVVMIFDEELGEYRRAERRCVAIWPVSGPGHDSGRACGRPATHQVADVQVCEHHYRRIRDWMNERDKFDVRQAASTVAAIRAEELVLEERVAQYQRRLDRETAQLRTELAREQAALQIELDRQLIQSLEAARAEVSRVYFVTRESDGLIKIGTSRDLPGRLKTLKREHGTLHLIATVPGAHKEETAQHRRFADLRAEKEWFRPELPLLEHLYALMKERPLEPAPGLPPIVARREIGSLIWKLRMAPTLERRRQEAEAREKRRLARNRRKAA